MKIIYKKGNALEGLEQYLAHGCNNRGKMGSGIAKAIRAKYPSAYDYYRWIYMESALKLGCVYAVKSNDKTILNCITQDGYGYDGNMYVNYGAIENCMKNINMITKRGTPVAMPKIGAGLGGGDWNHISKIIEDVSTFQPVVYEL